MFRELRVFILSIFELDVLEILRVGTVSLNGRKCSGFVVAGVCMGLILCGTASKSWVQGTSCLYSVRMFEFEVLEAWRGKFEW